MPSQPTASAKESIWNFRLYKEYEWFRFLVILLLSLAGLYLLLHFLLPGALKVSNADYEYQKLDERQQQQINRIYFDSASVKQDTEAVEIHATDSVESDTIDSVVSATGAKKDSCYCTDKTRRCNRALAYINNEFSGKVDSQQMETIKAYLCFAPPLEAASFLADVRFRVRSYFWLTGPEVYFEIIFWSLFGVIGSILYNLSIVSKDSTTDASNPRSVFDSSEIPSQIAKMLYAPLCTLAIVLGYNFLADENVADIGSSKGVITFSFIGGFFSSRLISFLDRLKEVILPSNQAGFVENKQAKEVLLKNILIELKLGETTVTEDQKLEINEIGFGTAEVTLQSEEGGDLINAVRTGEDQASTFVVNNIKAGKYIIKAKWSYEQNEELINLEAEKTEDIKMPDVTIEVEMKKAKSEG